jgi:hypothetical protein
VAITQGVIDLADQLLCQYASDSHLVEVSPGLDGSISFLWDDEKGNYAYMSVGPNDTVHLYYDVVGTTKWEGVGVASDQQLRAELSRAFRFLHPIAQAYYVGPLHQSYVNMPIPTSNSEHAVAA